MPAHRFAELMAKFAEIALTSSTPWIKFQYKVGVDEWLDCIKTPAWHSLTEYRLKPETAENIMSGHEHAEMVAKYAEIAKENDRPWLSFQYRTVNTDGPKLKYGWAGCKTHPKWYDGIVYRLKPETVENIMSGHRHAEMIIKLGEIAKTDDEPWLRMQYKRRTESEGWENCTHWPAWSTPMDYRLKPETIMIGDVEINAPEREVLEQGENYHVPSLSAKALYTTYKWVFSRSDYRLLESGVVFRMPLDAIECTKALIKLTSPK